MTQPLNANLQASITVKDVQKSLTWFRDTVGFTVEREMERDGKIASVVLRAGPLRMLLNQDDGKKGWDRKKGEGLSLQVSLTEGVDEVAARLKAAGWPLETEPADMPWGQRAFRVLDPDGFKWSFSQPVKSA